MRLFLLEFPAFYFYSRRAINSNSTRLTLAPMSLNSKTTHLLPTIKSYYTEHRPRSMMRHAAGLVAKIIFKTD